MDLRADLGISVAKIIRRKIELERTTRDIQSPSPFFHFSTTELIGEQKLILVCNMYILTCFLHQFEFTRIATSAIMTLRESKSVSVSKVRVISLARTS